MLTAWWHQPEVLFDRAELIYFDWNWKSFRHFVLWHIHIWRGLLTAILLKGICFSLHFPTPITLRVVTVFTWSAEIFTAQIVCSATLFWHLFLPLQRLPNRTHAHHYAKKDNYPSLWTDWESDTVKKVSMIPGKLNLHAVLLAILILPCTY